MSHFVSSRSGLFVFDKETAVLARVLEGKFFGMARRDKRVYIFGFEGDRNDVSRRGFIVSFIYENGKFSYLRREITGLDNGCHQMTIWEDHLYIVETYIQRLVKIRIGENDVLDEGSIEYLNIWPSAVKSNLARDLRDNSEYLHVNALTVQDGRFFFMCPHLGRFGEPKPSKIQIWSPLSGEFIDEYNLDRWFCHDLVVIGHQVFFCDATGAICNLNLVTRKVIDVFRVPDAPLGVRNFCRGLSISKDEEMVASVSWPGKCGIFTREKFFRTDFDCAATFITRLDGVDYNDTSSDVRSSCVVTLSPRVLPFFENMVEPLDELLSHSENKEISKEGEKHHLQDLSDHNYPKTMDEFLNPVFESLDHIEPYIDNKEKVVIINNPDFPEISESFLAKSNNFALSGQIYYYANGHGMGWHTNIAHVQKFPTSPFRCYLVRSRGTTFFFYRHPISKKIHAVHDIDASINVFRLDYPDHFWHSIGSVNGSRISIGFRTGLHGIEELGVNFNLLV